MFHDLAVWLGLTNASGGYYLFWSGFFGDLGILAAVLFGWRKLNCHAKGCPRVGIHRVDGTPYVTCRKHHPDIEAKPTALQIAMHHRAHK